MPTSNDEALADTVLAVTAAWIEAWNELDADRLLGLHGSNLLR